MNATKHETRNTKHDTVKLEDFRAWHEAIVLAEEVYQLSGVLPDGERYGLISQLRRAVVSVSANLAEGYGRQSAKDKEHFYIMARGSLYEVKSLLTIATRLHFIDQAAAESEQLQKCLNYVGALLRVHRGNQ